MADAWTQTALGAICRFQAGDAFGRDDQGRTVGDHPFIKVSDMNLVGNEIYISRANNWVSDEETQQNFRLHPKDAVVFAKIGIALTYNRRRRLVRPTAIDNNMMSAVPAPDVDPIWFYYLLSTIDFNLISSGSALPYLTVKDLSRIQIDVPAKREQQAIASILGALDDKIELNRRMNETLEAMARAIFQNEELSGGWTESLLGDICVIFDGPHATPKLSEIGPIFLGISNLNNGLIDISNTNHVSENDFSAWTRRVTPSPLDIVFSYETRLGQVAIIPKGLKCCLGRRMGLLRFKPGKTHPLVLLQAYMASEFQETIRQRTIHGSTVDRIPLKEMANFPIRVPTGPSMEELGQKLSVLWDMIEHNQQESRTLAQTRDLLLPKLMSGEIRVRDAETLVENVL